MNTTHQGRQLGYFFIMMRNTFTIQDLVMLNNEINRQMLDITFRKNKDG